MSTTPLIVDTKFPSFNSYINSLSFSAKRNYKWTMKVNKGVKYKEVEYNRDLVNTFMQLWEKQLIRKGNIQWAFPIGHIDDLHKIGVLRCFAAIKEQKVIALHFVEDHKGYVECHPPMYDKILYSRNYMGKFMWFSLIEYAIENKMGYIDLGGGDRGNWREFIRMRAQHPRTTYKWAYIPKFTKDNPDLQPRFLIANDNGHKYLYEERI